MPGRPLESCIHVSPHIAQCTPGEDRAGQTYPIVTHRTRNILVYRQSVSNGRIEIAYYLDGELVGQVGRPSKLFLVGKLTKPVGKGS
jgi:hypothetical protein